MIIIGSSALKHLFPDFNRSPKDLDIAVLSQDHKQKVESDLRVEYLVNSVLCDYMVKNHPYEEIIPANVLLTLKISHLFWDISWDKHMFDTQFLLKKGCKLIPTLFNDLYDYWNTVHIKNERSKLNMSADDFFDNAIKCPYHHDDLHTLLKNPPTYTLVLKDGEEVEVSEEKFNNLDYTSKSDLVREEVMVMAWERYFNKDYRTAYATMLKKFIISHAPIWEAIFIIENYIPLLKPGYNYFETINTNLYKLKQKTI